jgi:hypothetical protein
MLSGMSATATTTIFSVVNSGASAYAIDGTNNPNLTLVRGSTYAFQLNASGHPFWIKTIQGTGTGNAYTNGIAGNGTSVGTLTFVVPSNAPALLFYNCQFHGSMTGQLLIVDPPGPTLLAVDVSTNAAYAGGFTNGSNGGFGFEPWELVGTGSFTGGFIGDSTQNGRNGINVGGAAFALYANPTPAVVDARRVFSGGAMPLGATFSFDLNVSWNGGDRGFILYQGAYTNDRLKINHGGGDALRIDGVPLLTNVFNQALRVSITALSGTRLRVQVSGSVTSSTTVAVAGLPDRFKFYYSNTAGDTNNESNYEPYFNNLVLTVPATHHVALGHTNAASPYTSWATAATNIQDAIDAAEAGAVVLVSNGVYETGGRPAAGMTLTNRVTLDKVVTVLSVNGPDVTTIRGAQDPATTNGDAAVRCVWMGDGATLTGFTLTNGATRMTGSESDGGGIWSTPLHAVEVNDCILAGNAAGTGGGGGAIDTTLNRCTLIGNWTTGSGGGTYGGELNRCVLIGNSAAGAGGAAAAGLYNCLLAGNSSAGNSGGAGGGILINCTVVGNSAGSLGGGTAFSTLKNCIVVSNTAPSGSNDFNSTVSFTCTTPLPGVGDGNIANDPQFADSGAGNYRLKASSPGLNVGTNGAVVGTTDLDDHPRIAGGAVDLGAYEYDQTLAQSVDSDADGFSDQAEYIADTSHTNGADFFPEAAAANAPPGTAALVIDPTSPNRVYGLYVNTNLLESPQQWTLVPPVQTGNGSTLTLTAPSAVPLANYRTGVRLP